MADEKKLEEVAEQISSESAKEISESLTDIIKGALASGNSVKSALNISDDALEGIYSYGYNLYNQGRYQDSSYIFRFLSMIDYQKVKYLVGLAACLHQLEDYFDAIPLYMLAGQLDPENPLPFFHASDCFIKLNQLESAVAALDLCLMHAGDNEKYTAVKEKSLLMKKGLQEQLKGISPAKPSEKSKKDKAEPSEE